MYCPFRWYTHSSVATNSIIWYSCREKRKYHIMRFPWQKLWYACVGSHVHVCVCVCLSVSWMIRCANLVCNVCWRIFNGKSFSFICNVFNEFTVQFRIVIQFGSSPWPLFNRLVWSKDSLWGWFNCIHIMCHTMLNSMNLDAFFVKSHL